MRSFLTFLCSVLLSFAIASVTAAETLYGVTAATPAGDVDLVKVNTTTGQATTLASVSVGAGNTIAELAYHPTDGRLVSAGIVSGSESLILIDPVTAQLSTVTIVGLAGIDPSVAGIEYDAGGSRLLVSYSDDGSQNEDRVAEVGLDGTVASSTTDFTPDIDALGYRTTTSDLLGFDLNALSAQRVFTISGLFGAPSVVTIGSPPFRSDVGDTALDSSGVVYVNGFGGGGGFLVRLDSDTTYVDLGAYNASAQLTGLAFGPSIVTTPSLSGPLLVVLSLALALAALVLERRRTAAGAAG